MDPKPPGALAAVFNVIRFYSRLPVPRLRGDSTDFAMPDFERAAWAVTVGGAVIATFGALVGAGAMSLGLSPMIAAVLTIIALVVVTGCFHEDGLADACDGLWGGWTIERRLEIMKDSRIGSYGAAALGLSLMLRVAALSELYRLLGPSGALIVIGIGGLTRSLALAPTLFLPPARQGGLAWQALHARTGALVIALLVALAFLIPVLWILALLEALPVLVLVCAALLPILIAIMRNKIGGFTGDTLGASQQIFEIALLLVLCGAAAWRGPL